MASLAIVFLSTMSGCQNNVSPDQVKKLTMNQERRIGILQSLGGAYTSSQATHLLRMEDGKTVYLRSSTVDLKNEKYLGNEVEVMGEITRTTDGNQTMNVNSIDLIDTEINSNEDLPEWVDYESENLGLSLKYRNDYTLKESGNEVLLQPKPTESEESEATEADSNDLSEIKLVLISKDSEFNLASEMGVNSLINADILAGGYNRSKITQKAVDAYKKSSDGGKEIVYFLKNSEGSYKISFLAGEVTEDLIGEQNMFYDILASVDFSGMPLAADEDINSEVTEGGAEKILSPNSDGNIHLDEEVDDVIDESEEVDSSITSGEMSGFSTFSSETQKFSIQYPKSYYYGSVSANTGALKSYQFGTEPLEEQAGEINLDIVSSVPDAGKETEYAGKVMTVVSNGGQVSVYAEQGGKVFKLTASSSREGLLKQMASTLAN